MDPSGNNDDLEAQAVEGADATSPDSASSGSMSAKTLFGALGAAVLAGFLLLVVFSGGEDQTVAPSDELAALAFLTADGETSNLAEFRGEPLVVNFFASWCAPCRAELPDFEAVHQANGEAVTFLGVSHDFEEATWRGFVAETEITFETVFQPNQEIWKELDAIGLPATVFISPDGEVLELWNGVLNDELLQDKIDEHLRTNA